MQWLNDYVDLSGISADDLVNRLTLTTCEVDGYEKVFEHLDGIIAAKIISRKKHPDAEKLSICTVDTGSKKLEIVCGAPNAVENITVPLAGIGSRIPSEDGYFEIKKAKIRGVESPGMLCSSSELGLDGIVEKSEGLLILDEKIKPGTSLSSLFPGIRDIILDIDNKSITHRPDLWCHFGFAREIAAIFGKKIKFNPLDIKFPKTDAKLPVKKIAIEKGAAKAYYGVYSSGIKIVPSPLWMQIRLIHAGQKPINNIVDASNYTMLELGQPNHTFDAAYLKNDTVSVASTGKSFPVKKFTTLDEVERIIPEESVMILDGKPSSGTPVAIGGIMGGLDSGIKETTSALFLESATFRREKIRRTLSGIQLRTDSAVRFEKGQDPAKAKAALARLIDLISLTCPEIRTGKISGESPEKEVKNKIKISLSHIRERLGFNISEKEVVKTLTSLFFEVSLPEKKKGAAKSSGNTTDSDAVFSITVPTFRSQYDITIPEDIIEELGRVYGYDNIKPAAPRIESQSSPQHEMHAFERFLKNHASLAGGFTETYNYSFASKDENLLFSDEGVKLKNPIQSDSDRLRLSQIPGLLKQAAFNQDRFENIRMFELGRIYLSEKTADGLPVEKKRLNIIHLPPHVKSKNIHPDDTALFQNFLSFRSYLERLMNDISQTGWNLISCEKESEASLPVYLHPGCSVKFTDGSGKTLGHAGILHPSFEKQFDLKRSALIAEVFIEELYDFKENSRKKILYSPPSVFPDSRFELSIVMNDKVSTADPVSIVEKMKIPEIKGIRLLTIYRGEPLPEDKKSASYEVLCGTDSGTLSGEKVQEIMDSIIKKMQDAGFPLR